MCTSSMCGSSKSVPMGKARRKTKRAGEMELLGLRLARPWYVRLRLLMWWNYPNTNGARFVSVEFVEMQGTNNPPTP